MHRDFFKKILFFLPTIISLIVATFLWKIIKFEFSNPNEIIGYYSIFQHNHWNDNIRYIVFIIIPLTTYFFTIFKKKKIKFIEIKEYFFLNDKIEKKKEQINKFYLFFFIILLFFLFLSGEFNKNSIDLFHEGQALVGGLNYEITNKFWSNSFLVTSLFVDVLSSKISWDIFDVQSISSYRLYINIVTKITFLTIVIFLFYFCNKLNLDKISKTSIFIVLSIFCFYLINNNTLSYRELPIFIFLIFLIKSLEVKEMPIFYTIILGILPLFSLLWSLDRGVFLIATYIPMISLYLFNNRYKQLLYIFLASIISFIIFFFIVGYDEFYNFVNNSIDILKSSDLLNGLIHPNPFTNDNDSSRATKSLLIIILNGIISISLILDKDSKLKKNHKFFILIFYFLSVIFYKIGLTRSDGGHIKQGSSLSLILLIYFVLFYLFSFIEKKYFFEKFKKVYSTLIFVTLLFLFSLQNISSNFYVNILNFKNRYTDYVNTNDYNYLDKGEIKLINKLKVLTKNEPCFQIFTYETAIQYYLKKQSCTKFFHIMNMGSKKNQLLFIQQLKDKDPKYLLTGGTYQNIGNMKGRNNIELGPKERFSYIEKYIHKNFEIYEKIGKWKIVIKKK